MSDRSGAAPSADPLDWAPMRPATMRRPAEIANAIIEPLWSGVRVIALVGPLEGASRDDPAARAVRMLEGSGADVASELPDLARALDQSVDAVEAVVDGVITPQIGLQGIGAATVAQVRASPSRLFMTNRVDVEYAPPRGADAGASGASPDGFVAVDLLRLDGVVLLDVPLLERKRLLESVIVGSDLIRVSVHTRPPVDTWIATWKALGLRGGILKGSNSRYRPGTRSPEWRVVETVGRRAG